MSPAEKQAREEQADRKMRAAADKAYNKEMPEPDTTFGKLGRKAAGAAMAPAGALVGGALLGTQPGSPGIIESAKFGAKSMYHTLAGNKKEDEEATKSYLDAAKRAQSVKTKRNTGENTNPAGDTFKRGGKVSSASSRADGCATKGKTKGTMITMKNGGMC
jgi:hypothetical protein